MDKKRVSLFTARCDVESGGFREARRSWLLANSPPLPKRLLLLYKRSSPG